MLVNLGSVVLVKERRNGRNISLMITGTQVRLLTGESFDSGLVS